MNTRCLCKTLGCLSLITITLLFATLCGQLVLINGLLREFPMEVVVDETSTNNINYQYCCKTLLALQQGCKQVFALSILLALFLTYFIYLVKKQSCKDA